MDKMAIIWAAMAVVFTVLEIVTVQVVSIWFTIGAVSAFIAYFLGADTTVQLIVFVAVSVVALVLTRPFVKKFTKTKLQPTNADMCIGQQAVVTEKINNTHAVGAAKVRGVEWTARSFDGEEIEEGEIVTVKAIEGAKIIVERKS